MSYHIEKMKGFRIVGIRTSLVENAEENMRIVPAFWEKTLRKYNGILEIADLSNGNPKGILITPTKDP